MALSGYRLSLVIGARLHYSSVFLPLEGGGCVRHSRLPHLVERPRPADLAKSSTRFLRADLTMRTLEEAMGAHWGPGDERGPDSSLGGKPGPTGGLGLHPGSSCPPALEE